jgi:hypothetical protein
LPCEILKGVRENQSVILFLLSPSSLSHCAISLHLNALNLCPGDLLPSSVFPPSKITNQYQYESKHDHEQDNVYADFPQRNNELHAHREDHQDQYDNFKGFQVRLIWPATYKATAIV